MQVGLSCFKDAPVSGAVLIEADRDGVPSVARCANDDTRIYLFGRLMEHGSRASDLFPFQCSRTV